MVKYAKCFFVYFSRVLFQKLKWSDAKWELSNTLKNIQINIFLS